MSTTTTEQLLDSIIASKNAIIDAIIAKGVDIPTEKRKLEYLAEFISQIGTETQQTEVTEVTE